MFRCLPMVVLCLCGLLMPAPGLAVETLRLVYSGNLDSELEPCGCSIDTDYGGILRRATFVDRARETQPGLVLITTGGLFSPDRARDRIKHRFILSGLARLDYDAVGVQWRDLVHGVDFLGQAGLPVTATNWLGPALAESRLIERGTLRLRYFQWLDPATSPYRGMAKAAPIETGVDGLRAALDQSREAGEITVLATTLTLEDARSRLPLELVDILIQGAADEQVGAPEEVAGTLVLQPGSRGQRLGVLDLRLAEGRIQGWQHRVQALPNTIPDAPRLADWYEAYNEALREDYEQRVARRRAEEAGVSPYVGAEACEACHQGVYDRWQETDHASAMGSLSAVGKQFDPHCVGCHAVGFGEPGGYLDPTLTDHLANVQCENCHGPGRAHVDSGGQQATANRGKGREAICRQCHVPDHSPAFTLEAYWPRIAHP